MVQYKQQLEYWIQYLEGSQPAEFFCDKPRPATLSGEADEEKVIVDGSLYKDLQDFCQTRQVTPFTVLLSAFRATHFRLTSAEDATIGSIIANQRGQELESLTGFFVNLQCIRTKIQDESFISLVQQVELTTSKAFENQDVPFEKLIGELKLANGDASRNPLIQTTFAVHSREKFGQFASEVNGATHTKGNTFDLEFHLYQDQDGFRGSVLFARDLFYSETVKSMVSVFYETLRQGLCEPDIPIASIPLTNCLSATNDSESSLYDYPRESSVIDLFRQQVAACPSTVAVKDASTQLTYIEVDQQSDRVCRWLIKRGLEAETLVGVFAPRSCETIVAFLGILKANLAYLPLDIATPPGRIETILSSVRGHKIVFFTEEAPQSTLDIEDIEAVRLVDVISGQAEADFSQQNTRLEAVGPSATSLAYVMFTSGSTGQPKGVMTEHRSIIRLIMQPNITSRLRIGTRVAHLANIAFDGSTWEIYTALLSGGTIICLDILTVLDTTRLGNTIRQEEIRLAKFTPALLHQCLIDSPSMFGALDIFLVIGERLNPRDAQKILDWTSGSVYNAYGPTESTGHTTLYEIRRDEIFTNGVPIGRAISNSCVSIMDSKQQIVPDGVIGEIVVTGDGLARGYLKPQQNKDRFVNIWAGSHSVRAYRTGDYARRRPVDGELEFLGRMDHQIKIRGHRVELGEVEYALLSNGEVSEAAVLVQNVENTGPRLVGFVTMWQYKGFKNLTNGTAAEAQSAAEQLRNSLQSKLPIHMVPTVIKVLEKMPINQNRKIDRQALAKIEMPATSWDLKNRIAPRNDTEHALCEEFAAVLCVNVGITDSFFKLGGHSLMATKLISRINRRLETGITIKDIFDCPIVSDLSEMIRPLLGSIPYVAIPKYQHSGSVEQSFAQGRLWFLDQLYPGSTRYLMPYRLRLRGPLYYSALQSALWALESRHETLRTTFEEQNGGVGVQVVQSFHPKQLRVVEVSQDNLKNLDHLLHEEQMKPFNLQTEPGWRAAVFQLNNEDHVLSIVFHHIISDGWSLDVFQRELETFYSAAIKGDDPLSQISPLPIQYRDFAIWQKEQEQSLQYEQQLSYWTEQLKGSQPAEFLYDGPRPATLSGEASEEEVIIEGALYKNLQDFCQAHQITPYTVLLSTFRATHFRLTGTGDATIGSIIANRNRQELENLIGFFVNLQCIRCKIQDDESFESLVQQMKLTITEAFKNQDIPFEKIVAELKLENRDLSRNPLVQTTFAVHSRENFGQFALKDLEVNEMTSTKKTRFDLEFHLYQEQDSFRGSVLFAKELFHPKTVRSMVSVFYEILTQGLRNPNFAIASIPLTGCLSPTRDSEDLLHMKRTNYPRESSVAELFREQVAVCPGTIAVKDDSAQLTYTELDQKSDRVCQWLIGQGLRAETLIAVYAPRSCETVIAFLGILKANLAYLPLDIATPSGRIEAILSSVPNQKFMFFRDEAPQLTSELAEDIKMIKLADVLSNHSETDSLSQKNTRLEPVGPLATSLAYVMFTSGSTGKPKGVMIEHRGIIRLAKQTSVVSHLQVGIRISHIANIAFDASTWEIYTTILNGATLVCFNTTTVLDAKILEAKFLQEQIRVAKFTPVLLEQYLTESPSIFNSLQLLFSAGDRLSPHIAQQALNSTSGCVVNAYGPTENTGFSTCYNIRPEDFPTITNTVPIGQAINNSGAVVTDSKQRVVPEGVIGELVVTGDGLARGYLDPQFNKDRFVNIWLGGQSVRAYRTGDYARRRPVDNELEFLRRMDRQIKIRGYRVELGEVEHTLLNNSIVSEAVVLVQSLENVGSRLVSFVTLRQERLEKTTSRSDIEVQSPVEQLRNSLQSKLPMHMVPTVIKVLDKMPVNENKKVDRQALAMINELSVSYQESSGLVAPRNETERALCEEFAAILGVNVGTTDSFFKLGGHSLMATRVISRINKRLNIGLTVKDIFDYPVVSNLSEKARPLLGSAPYMSIPKCQHNGGPVEQSFAQGRLWFLDQLYPDSNRYLMPYRLRLYGPLRYGALQSAFWAIESRHETLRTTFEEQDGVGVQIVHPFHPQPLRVIKSSHNSLERLLHEEQMKPFNLQAEPGWRVAIFQLSHEDHVLSIVFSHIISDGWSLDVFRRELETFYSAAIKGGDSVSQDDLLLHAPPLSIQYRDFAVWQKEQAHSLYYKQQLNYWMQQLEGSQPAEFFCDKPRPAALSGEAGEEEVIVDGSLYTSLQTFCQRYQVTPFTVLLSAFRATHFRLTGAEDATIGSIIANRNRQELENLIGFFVNLQCVRTKVQDESFESLVQQVKLATTTAFENQDIPFEKIVAELKLASRDASRNPLVQTTFAVHSRENFGQFTLAGLDVDEMTYTKRTRFDLEFHLYQEKDKFQGSILFAKDLFYPGTIRGMISVFYEILSQGLREPHVPIISMALTDSTAGDLEDLLHVQRTDYPRESSVVDLFRKQVAACSSTVAVKDTSSQLTYAELDQQSDQVCRWLMKQGLETEALVGVFAPRSCETIVAFLGILKANLAYLPIDITTPPGRIETILSSVQGRKIVFFGKETPQVTSKIEDVETVRLMDVLNRQAQAHSTPDQSIEIVGPSATSLAYVMFTSGSTGQPKGVMIEHRGIVRLAKQTNIASRIQTGIGISHIANIAFDASSWEIYTAILNGATLVCFDITTVLDAAILNARFIQEQIRIAKFTPVLLEQYLAESPSIFSSLELLFSAGDRLSPHVARQALNSTAGSVFNAYGPTENTGFSTCFEIEKDTSLNNTVPIGQAINNSGAVVLDSRQRIVPDGVIGELVVTGDGLARGYLNSQFNKDRFVDIWHRGESVRAYRTGDYARRRPVDGELDFLGRMDRQVKIRGHRVELGEIEHTLLGNSLVSEAAVLAQNVENVGSRLVGFVTLRQDDGSETLLAEQDDVDEVEEVNAWTEIRKAVIYAEVDSIEAKQLGRDYMGWKSMYDGEEIDKEEMDDWLHDTIDTILNGGEAGHVLEVGTGTGMILFNLGEGLQSYFGLEPVETVANFVAKSAHSIPQLADKVKIQVGTATDVESLRTLISPTTTVINSVAQYFPSPEYFQKVVGDLLQLQTASYLFFGDIRSYGLYDEFRVTMAMHHVGKQLTKDQLRQYMKKIEENEKELLVDPAFFTSLKSKYPHLVKHVEILPKRMKASNELSCYRYAAVVHTNHGTEKIHNINEKEWIDFEDRNMDGPSLLNYLQRNSSSSTVAISNITPSRTFFERSVLESLRGAEEHGDWIASLSHSASRSRSLSPDDLAKIAENAGFRIELSWARQYSQRGALDAVFHHASTGPKGSRVLFQFPTDHEARPFSSFANRPLQSRLNRKIEKTLHDFLQIRLPPHMVPAVIKVLDKMPTNENRKVDRQALARIAEVPASNQNLKERVAPSNDTENALCEEFTAVLGTDVGITDSFFDLGGHSLMAARVVSRINNRLGCSISVFEFYQHTTVAALCELILSNGSSVVPQTSPSYFHCHSRLGSKATIVLIHGFWGQGNMFLPLLPLLDAYFDVILIHDPFFGKLEGPSTITEWAEFYLNDLGKCIKHHLPVILGGYSFGGLIAFEMASMWRNEFGNDPASMLLLDAGSYPSLSKFLSQDSMSEQTVSRALTIFGDDQKSMVNSHFNKLRSLSLHQIEQRTYEGDCLYLATPQACESATADWWKAHCPEQNMHIIDCGHHEVLGHSMVGTVAQLINQHYRLLIK